ncbi:MAG TPA: heme-binding protein [Streptosporangiaceae bacterium]|nr:heme-binding protein [Streptosporangiaceae bacterium]
MESPADFIFGPEPPIEEEPAAPAVAAEPAPPAAAAADPLGPLAGLAGNWAGGGFNVIWRPHPLNPSGQDRFLELNVTGEQLDFGPALRDIPNRGLLMPNISLAGLSYLQQIADANTNKNQHFEPGVWVTVPRTSDPKEARTVARMASIPHGTTILLQGTGHTAAGGPAIPNVSIRPFTIGHPNQTINFPEQDLGTPTQFRTSGRGLTGITQQMVNNPNSVLRAAPSPQITSTTTLQVSSRDASIPGGGTANIAFLTGAKDGPNAVAARVTATFWLETLQGDTEPRRLQYSQLVLLNFNGISWPHVTVATLQKQP